MSHKPSVRAYLKCYLDSAGFTTRPVKAFVDYPALEAMAHQFVCFVSPWLVVEEINLAEITLREAMSAYDDALSHGYVASHRRFIERIVLSARTLARLRISVQNREGVWMIWNYDEPLMRYLSDHARHAIQIRKRDIPLSPVPIMIKLLSAVMPARELEAAAIDYQKLLSLDAMAERIVL